MKHPPRIRSRLLAAAVGLVTLAGVTACGEDESAEAGGGAVDMTFIISSTSLAHQLVYAADDGGFFEDYGINAEIVSADSSAVAMAALVSGSADVAFVGRSEGVTTSAAGQPVVYAFKHSTGFLTNVTVSTEFADQHADVADGSVEERLRALDGATIAQASANGVLTKVLNNAMATVDKSVRNTFIGTNTMPTALKQGNVDGYMAPSPFQETSVTQGDGVEWIKGTDLPGSGGPDIIQGATVVTQKFVGSNREEVVRVIAALTATAEAMRDDPDEAYRLARERVTDVDDQTFDAMWEPAYQDIIGPLEHPMSVEDVEFMMDNDADGVDGVDELNAEDLVVDEDIVRDAREMVQEHSS